MKSSERQSGIELLGKISWGTHFCMFYQTQSDLLDILVNYFKAGLENNEYCMWITSEPLNEKDAENAMRMAIPKFDTYLQKNQIEIIPYTEWYLENNEFDSQRVLSGWVDKCDDALNKGFNGLRLTGNTFWLEEKDWKNFTDYEEEVNEVITSYNMIAVCTYSLEKCGSFEILDVVRNHQYAIFRREGTWEIFKGSDQTNLELKLKESEHRLKSFMNSATDGFLLYDAKLNYIDVNNVALQIIGTTKKELIGKNILDIAPNLKETGRYDKFLDVIKTGEPFSTDDAILKGIDGSLDTAFSVRAFKVGDNLGLLITDITERKKKEKELQLHSEIMKNLSEGIYLIRLEDEIIVYANPIFEEMFGYNPGEIIGKNVSIVNAPTDKTPEETKEGIVKILVETGEWHGEVNNIKKDGTSFWCYANVSLFDHPEYGRVIVAVHTDITEIKHVEEDLREVNKLKSEFLRKASHELKTPLISIKGFSELILSLHEDQLDPSIISKLREINAGCERLQNIIDNLLKASRLESPELRPSKHREDLSFLISFCVLELESMAERRKHSIKLDIHNQLYANIEKEEIHDVLSNLLSNAIKYTPLSGIIEIKTELREDFVVVSVRDNGIGFNDEQKKLIFQQFGKIERYGKGLDLGIGGTGLGLYISKKIVESHGGKIWMESKGKNMGSTFYFSLPKKIE